VAEDQDEKTEEPTEKKIEDAKKEGNVGKSAEVVGSSVLLFGSFYMLFFAGFSYERMMGIMQHSFNQISKGTDSHTIYLITKDIFFEFLAVLSPFFAIAVIFTIITNLAQFGFVTAPLKFDLQKIDPISGMKNVFSMQKLVEALKLMLKLSVVFAALFALFMIYKNDILYMMMSDFSASLDNIFSITIMFILTVLFIIIIFAIIDYYFVMYNYNKKLKMTKQEIKDEFKNMEGDPQVKGRIRSIQMKMARQRMMSDVAESDVVVTNPTHYAVALKYDQTKNKAPQITAKGINFIAAKIKEIALKNDIPVIENPPLARALYNQLEIGESIPQEFYKAVADIFTYVYELRSRKMPNPK
jgi:flagellar biosynthetic protein FlhB